MSGCVFWPRWPWLASVFLIAASASALPFEDYAGCAKLADRDPAQALQAAEAWIKQNGGTSAEHCSILALNQLKRYGEAAMRLDTLARNGAGLDFRERARLYEQAGNAWMLTGQVQKAEQSFGAGITQLPGDLELHAGRARARSLIRDWRGADSDLSAALNADQNRADILVLRAKVRRAQNRKTEAATDILRALTIFPEYAPALVERGVMLMEAGDSKGARADWTKAAKGQGDSAAVARRYLTMLGH